MLITQSASDTSQGINSEREDYVLAFTVYNTSLTTSINKQLNTQKQSKYIGSTLVNKFKEHLDECPMKEEYNEKI